MRVAVTMLVFCVASLLALGLVAVYSCNMASPMYDWVRVQTIAAVLGLVIAAVAASLDYRILRKAAVPLLLISIVLLALVLVPHIGVLTKGARRWFSLGPLRLQPSEIAKLALIIAVAWYCERYQRHIGTLTKGILVPGIMIASVLGLIFVEPDRGTTILLAAITGIMLLVAGVKWKYFLPPVLAGIIGLVFSIYHDPVRGKRIMAWLYLEETRSEVGYQAWQSILAFGSGGVTGLGLGNSRQKLGFIPEFQTDFILPIIGEELGLVATLAIVAAFTIIVLCGFFIACRSADIFGLLMGVGLTLMLGFQAIINIGVVTSVLPNKGLPLPFISYGGSNLVTMLAAIGLLLSIARRSRAPEDVLMPGAEAAPATQSL